MNHIGFSVLSCSQTKSDIGAKKQLFPFIFSEASSFFDQKNKTQTSAGKTFTSDQLVGLHTLCHAAAASHVLQQSKTNTNTLKTQLDTAQWVLLKLPLDGILLNTDGILLVAEYCLAKNIQYTYCAV